MQVIPYPFTNKWLLLWLKFFCKRWSAFNSKVLEEFSTIFWDTPPLIEWLLFKNIFCSVLAGMWELFFSFWKLSEIFFMVPYTSQFIKKCSMYLIVYILNGWWHRFWKLVELSLNPGVMAHFLSDPEQVKPFKIQMVSPVKCGGL